MTTYTTDSPIDVVEINTSLQLIDGYYCFVKTGLYDQGAGLVLNDDDGFYYVNTGSLPRGLKLRTEGINIVMET